MTEEAEVVYIRYRNHRGVTAWRRIIPVEIGYHATAWHGEPQWILRALDLDKDADRDFAMKDVLEWRTAMPETKE